MPAGIFSHAAIKAESRSFVKRLGAYLLAAFLGLLAVGFSMLLPEGFTRPTLMVTMLAVLVSALSDGRIAGWICFATSLTGFLWLLNRSHTSLEQSGSVMLLAMYFAVCAVLIEIVHRLRHEQRHLIDRDHRLTMAQRAARIWFWEIDLSTLEIHWSQESLGVNGEKHAQLSEALENYLINRVYPEDVQLVRSTILDAIHERRSFELEYRVQTPNGEIRWISSKGKVFSDADQPAMMLGMATDITAKKQAEESETRFDAMLSSLVEGVCYFDLDGRVEYLNPAAQVLLKCGPDAACGKNIHELVHGRSPESAPHSIDECPILNTPRSGRAAQMSEDVFKSDGTTLTVEYNLAPVHYEGRLAGAVLSFRDIAERKRAEHALRESEKLASTGRIAATISHELKNPLESVHYLLYLLEQSKSLSEKDQNYLQTAEQELGRMEQIVKQTLGFHRQGAAPVPVNMAKLLKGILLLYSKKLEQKKISVVERYDFNGEIPAFSGEIRQVLSNLMVNAVEAMEEGGRLTLHVRAAHEWKGEQRWGVIISVLDNGPGIRREARNRLFEPFFTTKGEKGTGLGLWVSSGIVQKHKGSIRVRSSNRPGRSYTCFSVFLPFASKGDNRLQPQQLHAA